jgi:molybdopterin converting factor subunit 1
MKVRVLFFSILQDLTGERELVIELPDDATMAALLELLFQRWPKLGNWDESLLLAIDQTYVKRQAPLHDGAEIALMPPVQGG